VGIRSGDDGGFGVGFAAPPVPSAGSFCNRYRGFDVAGAFEFLLQSLPRVWLGIIFFIFFDPCAGRHLLLWASAKKSKQEKALHLTAA
jgi:hypothetical protein